jgi:low affinity Fe/Cu permease
MKNLQTYEEFINESQYLIFDEIGSDITNLQDKIDELLKKDISDPKWIVALKGIQSACRKVEDMISKADQKLGAIPYNESAINEGV